MAGTAFNLEDLLNGSPEPGASYSPEPIPGDNREQNRAYARQEAEKRGLNPDFVDRLFTRESGYNRRAVSNQGAQGIGQMIPGTARRYGLKNPFDAKANIDASLDYLTDLHTRFNGDERKVAAGYFAGEGAAEKALANPRKNPKTKAYADAVAGGPSTFRLEDLLETDIQGATKPVQASTTPGSPSAFRLEDLLSAPTAAPPAPLKTQNVAEPVAEAPPGVIQAPGQRPLDEQVDISAGQATVTDDELYREWYNAIQKGDLKNASLAAKLYEQQFPTGENIRHVYDPVSGVDSVPLGERKDAREGAVAIYAGDLATSGLKGEELRQEVERRFAKGLGFDDASREVFKEKYGFDPARTAGETTGKSQIKQSPEEFEKRWLGFAKEGDKTGLIHVPRESAEKIQEFFNDKRLSDPSLAQAEGSTPEGAGALKKGTQQLAAGATQGMVGTLGSSAKGAGILLREASRWLSANSKTPISDMLISGGDWLNKFSQEASFEQAPESEKSLLSAFGLGQGLGSGATFALTGGAGKIGAGIAGALSQAGSSYDETYKRLIDRGMDPKEAHRAAMNAAILNVPVGFTEMFGVGGSLERALEHGVAGAGFAKNLLASFTKGAVEEGSQEKLQQRLGNAIAQVSGDPKRPLSDGEAQAAIVALVTGGLMEGGTAVATGETESAARKREAEAPARDLASAVVDAGISADTTPRLVKAQKEVTTSGSDKGSVPGPVQRETTAGAQTEAGKTAEAATGKAAEKEVTTERRTNIAERKRVSEMTPEEKDIALLTNHVTGLPNARAYDEAPKRAVQAHSDVDGLKWINDNYGHEAGGDQLLKAKAQVLRDAGIEAYHASGDEFSHQFDTPEQAERELGEARDRLSRATITVELPDGSIKKFTGASFSYGIGETATAAETALQANKTERAAAGERSERGGRPPKLAEEAPQGKQDNLGETPAEEVKTLSRLPERPHGNATASKALFDRTQTHAQSLSSIVNSQTFQEQGLSGFNIPSQRVVMSRVLRAIHDPKVFDSVVELVPVVVMNKLLAAKSASEVSLHDKSMFLNHAVVDTKGAVSLRSDVADALIRNIAGVRAEGASVVPGQLRPVSENRGTAGGTLAGDSKSGVRPVTSRTTEGPAGSSAVTGISGKLKAAGEATIVDLRHGAGSPKASTVSGASEVQSGAPPIVAQKGTSEVPLVTVRKLHHERFGEVSVVENQAGVEPGHLRVTDPDGTEHVIQNPRTQGGNREATFVKSEVPPEVVKAKARQALYDRLAAARREPKALQQIDTPESHQLIAELIDDLASEGIRDFKTAAGQFRDGFGRAADYGEIFEKQWDANTNVKKRGKLSFADAIEAPTIPEKGNRRSLTDAVIGLGRLKSTGFSGVGEKRMLSVKEGGRLGLFSDKGANAEDMMGMLEAEGFNFDGDLNKFIDALIAEAHGEKVYSQAGASEEGSDQVDREWEAMAREEFAEKSDHTLIAKAFDNPDHADYKPWIEAYDGALNPNIEPDEGDIEYFKELSRDFGLSDDTINRHIIAANDARRAKADLARSVQEREERSRKSAQGQTGELAFDVGVGAIAPTDRQSFKKALIETGIAPSAEVAHHASEIMDSLADSYVHDLKQTDPKIDSAQAKEAFYKTVKFGKGIANGQALEQSAWHGSPFHFDKFTLEHMGKGEGAQAYGWGLYFAGNREVAEYYEQHLGRFQLIYDGEVLPEYTGMPDNPKINAIYEVYRQQKQRRQGVRGGGSVIDSAVASLKEDQKAYVESSPYRAKIGRTIEAVREIDPTKIKAKQGALYKVDLKPEEDEYLLWDSPLSKQSEKVQKALANDPFFQYAKEMSDRGADLYEVLAGYGRIAFDRGTLTDIGKKASKGSREAASKYLLSLGIPGIKYRDQGSRTQGQGQYNARWNQDGTKAEVYDTSSGKAVRTFDSFREADEWAKEHGQASYNYVIFNDADIAIEQVLFQGAFGATSFVQTGEAIIHAGENPNESTALHELKHALNPVLFRLAAQENAPATLKAAVQAIETESMGLNAGEFLGLHDKWVNNTATAEERKRYRDAQESDARKWEGYLREGKAPTEALKSAFAKFKEWLSRIYQRIRPDMEMSDNVRRAFDRILGGEREQAAAKINPVDHWNFRRSSFTSPEVESRFRQIVRDAVIAGGTEHKTPVSRAQHLERVSQLSPDLLPEIKKLREVQIVSRQIFTAASQYAQTLTRQAQELRAQITPATLPHEAMALEDKVAALEHDATEIMAHTVGVRSEFGRNLALLATQKTDQLSPEKVLAFGQKLAQQKGMDRNSRPWQTVARKLVGLSNAIKNGQDEKKRIQRERKKIQEGEGATTKAPKVPKREPWRNVMMNGLKANAQEASARLQELYGKKLYQEADLSTEEMDRVRAKFEALKKEAAGRPIKIVVEDYLKQGGLFGSELNSAQQGALREMANPQRRAALKVEQKTLFDSKPTLESRAEQKGQKTLFGGGNDGLLFQDAELPTAAHDIATILAARIAEESQTKTGLPLDRILDEMRNSFPDIIGEHEEQIKATADSLLKDARRQALISAARDPEQRVTARQELARDISDAKRVARDAEKAAEKKQKQINEAWEADGKKAEKEAAAAWDRSNRENRKVQEAVAAQLPKAEQQAQRVFERQQRAAVIEEARRISEAAKLQEQQRLDDIADEAREELKRAREAAMESVKSNVAPEARARRKAEREAPQKARRWETPIIEAAAAARERIAADPNYTPTIDDLAAIGAEKTLQPDMTAPQWHREMSQYGEAYTKNVRKIRDAVAEMKAEARRTAIKRRVEEKAAGKAEGVTKPAERAQAREDYQKWAAQRLTELAAEEEWQNKRIRTAKRDMAKEFGKLQTPSKLDTMLDLLALPISLASSVDLPHLRQGLSTLLNHPSIWWDSLWRTVHTWTEAQMEKRLDELENSPLSELARLSGVKQSGLEVRRAPLQRIAHEEQFQNRLLRKRVKIFGKEIPVFLHAVVSERQYSTGMDIIRDETFKLHAQTLLKAFPPSLHPEIYSELGRIVNILSGVGDLGAFTQYAPFLNRFVLYATRYLASRFQLLGMLRSPLFYRGQPWAVRRIAARESYLYVTKLSLMFAGLAAAGLTSLDPDDDDFLKLRVPGTNQKWDLTGGMGGFVKVMFKLVRSAYRRGTGQKEFVGDSAGDTIQQFVRSKLAPAAGTLWDWKTGKTYVGEPFSWSSKAGELTVPMVARDIYDAVKVDGAKGLVMVPFGLLGGGVSAYRPRKMPDRTGTIAERYATGFLRERMGSKPETPEENKRRTLIMEMAAAKKAGKPTERIEQDLAKVGGPLTANEQKSFASRVAETPLQHAYRYLSGAEKDEVLKVATEEERQSIDPTYKKIAQSQAEQVKALEEQSEFATMSPQERKEAFKEILTKARTDEREAAKRPGGETDAEHEFHVMRRIIETAARSRMKAMSEFQQLDEAGKKEVAGRVGRLFGEYSVPKQASASERAEAATENLKEMRQFARRDSKGKSELDQAIKEFIDEVIESRKAA